MQIDKIVIHCSDTFPDMDIGRREIDTWHRERGWTQIGYHKVIRRSGEVERGRPENTPGAHVAGHNHNTYAICMVGGKAWDGQNPCNFTRQQWSSLENLVKILLMEHPGAEVVGHTDLDDKKTCPTFDVKAWVNGL